MNPSPLRAALLRAVLLSALIAPIAAGCVIPPEPGSATPPRSEVMQADARALAYGRSAAEILNNPQLSDKMRALFGADWSPPTPGVGKPMGAAPEYFEVGGPVRMVDVGGVNYIAVTGCAKQACAKQRGLLLVREGGEQLLARLDEGGFLHQYAYGPGMAGSSAAAGATIEGALTALERLSDGNPYPRPAP